LQLRQCMGAVSTGKEILGDSMRDDDKMSEGSVGFLCGILFASLVWRIAMGVMGVSSDFDRKGNFYVANESHGWVVRMDNSNGSATNITKQLPSVEEATKTANALNKDLAGKENNE